MKLEDLNKYDDVVNVTDNRNCGFMEGKTTVFVNELMNLVQNCLAKGDIRSLREDVGLECRLLQTNKGKWQKGKLMLRLEFISDEPLETDELEQIRQK
jgi:hypothetical protein